MPDYKLFDRRYSLQVGTILIDSNLEIQFSVKKSTKSTANTAEIKIYNLNEDHRAQLQTSKTDIYIKLVAGYREKTHQIFEGWVKAAPSRKLSTDWITEIQAGDGIKATQNALSSRTHGPGARASEILTGLLGDLGDAGLSVSKITQKVKAGDISGAVSEFVTGFTSAGKTKDLLDKFCKTQGLEWWIENKEVKIISSGSFLGNRAAVLNAASGMIGVPEIGKDGIVKVSSLLRGDIDVGSKIKPESKNVPNLGGVYRAETVTHTGDFFGGDWKTDIEGIPL